MIADIPGSELPDEYVIIGGHIDSWDGATGTTDNGTGVATTLEAARILMKAGVKPRRTIRFMLWSGEEQGLLGSRAYVKAHKELMPKISAVIVHDGGTNYLAGIGGTEAMQSDFEPVFAPIKELDSKYPFEVRKVAGLFGGGSDHASFLEANVPGFFWRQQGLGQIPAHSPHPVRHLRCRQSRLSEALVARGRARGLRHRQPRPSALPREAPCRRRNGQPPDARRPARRADGHRGRRQTAPARRRASRRETRSSRSTAPRSPTAGN